MHKQVKQGKKCTTYRSGELIISCNHWLKSTVLVDVLTAHALYKIRKTVPHTDNPVSTKLVDTVTCRLKGKRIRPWPQLISCKKILDEKIKTKNT